VEVHLGTIRQRMDENIEGSLGSKVILPVLRKTSNRKVATRGVTLVRLHVLGHVFHRVVGRVERVDLLELQHLRFSKMPRRELAVFVELSSFEHLLEDAHGGWPRGDAHLGAALVERSRDRKSKSPG